MTDLKDGRLAALERAASLLREEGEEDHADEIDTLVEMFTPSKGDDPDLARARRLTQAHCNNCGHHWGAMAMPAPMATTALTTIRLAQCARCFATEGVVLGEPGG